MGFTQKMAKLSDRSSFSVYWIPMGLFERHNHKDTSRPSKAWICAFDLFLFRLLLLSLSPGPLRIQVGSSISRRKEQHRRLCGDNVCSVHLATWLLSYIQPGCILTWTLVKHALTRWELTTCCDTAALGGQRQLLFKLGGVWGKEFFFLIFPLPDQEQQTPDYFMFYKMILQIILRSEVCQEPICLDNPLWKRVATDNRFIIYDQQLPSHDSPWIVARSGMQTIKKWADWGVRIIIEASVLPG